MSKNRHLLLSLGCITALLGACDNGGTTPPAQPMQTAGTAGPATSGTGATAGTGTPAGTAGTGTTTGTSGTGTTGTSGTGASGTGTTGTSGTGTMTTAGTGGGTSGTGGGMSGTGGTTTGAGFKACGKPAKEGMCKAKAPGVYAMKVDIDVYFRDENNDPTLYDPGRGIIRVFLSGDLRDVDEDGSAGVGTIQTCGDVIPPLLVDANCRIIQIVFPDEMWEKPGMPKIVTTGMTTGFNPQDVLSFAKAAG